MSNLIQAKELSSLLKNPDLRIIDARFALNDALAGQKLYEAGHIPKSIFFDLDKDLSQAPSKHGGRHPLPDMQAFAAKLAERGISNDSHVVVYDDMSAVFAGRVWFMLRYAGHSNVQVLDGGIQAWQAAGYALEATPISYEPTTFDLNIQNNMLVEVDYIRKNLDNPDVLLVDARARARYTGESEPLDPKAGHIPSAMNLSVTDNLENGKFKSVEALKEKFSDLQDVEEIIVYCGSGVSANHNLIAFEEAGIRGAKLYVGSWSDWSSYGDTPIATGDEP